MSDEKKGGKATAEFLKSAATHFKYDNQRQHAENEAAEFRAAFAEGKCSVCGQPIASCTKSKPRLRELHELHELHRLDILHLPAVRAGVSRAAHAAQKS